MNNIFTNLPAERPDESFETLLEAGKLRIERIVSRGQASPDGFWYDQDQPEWVLLLKGAARLRLDGKDEPIEMRPGDFMSIPAHTRHRVEWTLPDQATIWLAVHHG